MNLKIVLGPLTRRSPQPCRMLFSNPVRETDALGKGMFAAFSALRSVFKRDLASRSEKRRRKVSYVFGGVGGVIRELRDVFEMSLRCV